MTLRWGFILSATTINIMLERRSTWSRLAKAYKASPDMAGKPAPRAKQHAVVTLGWPISLTKYPANELAHTPPLNGGMLAQVVADFTSRCGQYRVSRRRLREYQTATIFPFVNATCEAPANHTVGTSRVHSAGSFATLAVRFSA